MQACLAGCGLNLFVFLLPSLPIFARSTPGRCPCEFVWEQLARAEDFPTHAPHVPLAMRYRLRSRVVINNVQSMNGSAIGKTVTHKIQGPSQVGLHWHPKCQCSPGSQSLLWFSVQIQCQITVNPSNSLVVPTMTLVSQVVGHLSTAPTWLAFCQLLQLLHNFVISCFPGLVAIGTAMHVYRPTGLPLAQPASVHYVFCQLTPLFHF